MCFFPKQAWQITLPSGKKKTIFNPTDRAVKFFPSESITVPCGHCVECEKQKAQEWSIRCMHELKYHKRACMITLTYNDMRLPVDGVRKADLQGFMKRLRRYADYHGEKISSSIRYFGSGEYGEKGGRPHYHIIIFGWCPTDLKFFKHDKRGNPIYLSNSLATIWGKGFVSVGIDLSQKTVMYCAKYLQKGANFDGQNPPFTLQSRKPMIGYDWLMANREKVEKDGFIYTQMGKCPVPRAYKDYLRRTFGILCAKMNKIVVTFERTLLKGYERAIACAKKLGYDYVDVRGRHEVLSLDEEMKMLDKGIDVDSYKNKIKNRRIKLWQKYYIPTANLPFKSGIFEQDAMPKLTYWHKGVWLVPLD